MAVHHIAMHYSIDPVGMLDSWSMQDLCDAVEAVEIQKYYRERAK